MNRPLLATLALLLLAAAAGLASAQQVQEVFQKRRAFSVREATLQAGQSLVFVNDDGELLHHVYAQDPRFSFDSGEQPAGVRTPVRFPVRGVFEVRCEIHPRMLLTVTVR